MTKRHATTMRRLCCAGLALALASCQGAPHSLLENVGASGQTGHAAVTPALTALLSRLHGPLRPAAHVAGWLSGQAASGKNLIYAAVQNAGSGQVNIYSTRGQAQQPIGVITNGVNNPEGLAVDSAGDLYVTNLNSSTVTVYQPGQLSPKATYSNGVSMPNGVAVGADGTIYVANETGGPGGVGSVTEYANGNPNPVRTLTLPGLYAFAVALDATGDLYVSWFDLSTYTPSIYKYAPGSTNGTNLDLNLPSSIFPAFSLAFDSAGDLVLAVENGNNLLPPKYIAVFPPGATNPSNEIEEGSVQDIIYAIAFPRSTPGLYYVTSTNFHDWMRLTYPNTIPRDVDNQLTPVSGLALSPGT